MQSESNTKLDIERSHNAQHQFLQHVRISGDFNELEKRAASCDSFDNFNTHWNIATCARDRFDTDHSKGHKYASKKYQSTALVVKDFMSSFSPIINIVQNFAYPYGGIAIGTISLLFAVASNKEKVESRISSVFSSITDQLPGLKTYEEIYNDKQELDRKLQSKIVLMYQKLTTFSIYIIKYYSGSGTRRWLRAAFLPSSFEDQISEIQDIGLSIRRLWEALLSKNVNDIKLLNEKLEDRVERLQQTNDNKKVERIQDLLKLGTFSSQLYTSKMHRYHKELGIILEESPMEEMQGKRLERFEQCAEYQTWEQNQLPCSLVLVGYNYNDDDSHCWLSPIALRLIRRLSDTEGKTIFAYYLLPSVGALVHEVLPVIILQLLQKNKQIFREKDQEYDEVCATLRGCRDSQDRQDTYSALSRAINLVISSIDESELVYIIVDRVDNCRKTRSGDDDRCGLLTTLVEMTKVARSRLKVLIIIDKRRWKGSLDDFKSEKVLIRNEEQGFRPMEYYT